MKRKVFCSIFIFFALAKLQAQDIYLGFAGSGAATTVETVQVQNLTQGTSLTLNGTDVLHLMGTVGIEDIRVSGDHSVRTYPNPMTENSNIEVEIPASGSVVVELFDLTGKKVASTQQDVAAGIHLFTVTGLQAGVYAASINAETFSCACKIISRCTAHEAANVSYAGMAENSVKPHFRSTSTTVPMQYTTGDRILLKAVSGIYSTVKTLVPVESVTEIFNFVAATDFDGNNYATVTIGTQVWMVENLKVTHYRNGEAIPNITDNAAWAASTTGAYSDYNNTPANADTYGRLYNGFAVEDARNLAPTGWHVPTDEEWTTLTSYLGGEMGAGTKLKATGITHWTSPNTGATNVVGFTALPGGTRDSYDGAGAFFVLGNTAGWWSSTTSTSEAWKRYLYHDSANAIRDHGGKASGLSVRCIRD